MKAIIIVYNRLTLPMKMADWLAERGVDPIPVRQQQRLRTAS